jgi:hypothetical protein
MDSLKKLSPQWWGAIAAAAAAGATVFAEHRVLGGLALGGAMLWLARKASAPCCASCAGQGDTEQQSQSSPFDPILVLSGAAAKVQSAPSGSCNGCEDLFS